ncbi:class I SAM-dependent methyltransferase, partial [Bacillus thuringiensis]
NILLDFTSNNLNEYLDYLAGVLKNHNFDIYYSVGSHFSNGIHLVSVIIPNSERFFGVLFGQIVFPSDRGKLKNKLNNSIELPMLDYDIRVQQETKTLDIFTNNRAQIKVKTCVSIHEEPYYTRENLFLIKLSEYTLCGRKLANHIDYENKTINIDSFIRTNMILGHFHTFQMNDKLVYMYYSPCTEAELNRISKLFSHDKQTEVLFPFSPLDDNFHEYLVSFNDWDSLNSGQLAGLDEDEVHFRDVTVQYLHTQETNNKVFYDPACSTGTFLGHLKQHFPLGKYIGSDQSNTMVALAKDKLDYAFQAEASQLTQDIQVDYLFLRFLNMEVVTIVQAYDLFEKLIRFLKPNGQLIIFGHTPVVINISYIADRYNLQIRKRIGIYNEAIFQYYILQK